MSIDNTYLDTIISTAYDKTEAILFSESGYINSDGKTSINLSSMFTLLVQETGRYAERFASDIIISVNSLEKDLEAPEQCNEKIYLFGIRENGVDHYEFVREQMRNYIHNTSYFEAYYRKIYAIRTYLEEDENIRTPELKVDMKDVRKNLSYELWSFAAKQKG